jgi:putative DNA primase/helicase
MAKHPLDGKTLDLFGEPIAPETEALLERCGVPIKAVAGGAKRPLPAPPTSTGWPAPQPMAAKVESEPYPRDALPSAIRAAVDEVAGFVKAPIPLVASSALAAVSLVCQAHGDVKRAEKLQGPTSLALLNIADSGERKSTVDGFFTQPIRDYEKEKLQQGKPEREKHDAAMAAWLVKCGGVSEKIRQLSKEGKQTEGAEGELRTLHHNKPKPPRTHRLIYSDTTPESLAYDLHIKYPSAGVISAEAGIVFGAHGMGKDSVMRNMALLNILWDGGSLSIDRRTSESFTLYGARLTMALQIQESTLREFFARSGALARGTGFLARFLLAWPESTQGTRFFTEPPKHWPHLSAFHERIKAILNNPIPLDENDKLAPPVMSMTPDAKAAWVAYHDAIERQLAGGGELYDVRDVASKSADNAVRLAALFQMFEGSGGQISLDAFERAGRIAAWHLNESRRFFGELALPPEMADAVRLDGWLISYCRNQRTHIIATRDVQRLGPIRDGEKLRLALQGIEELDRVRVTQNQKRKMIMVNPALLEVAQ